MIKKILFVAVGIIVTGLAVIALVILNYDFNRFKVPLARAVEKATGRRLTLDGNIGVALGLSPALVIEKVHLANAAWGSRPDMLQLRRLEIQVALLPLIGGTVEVKRFVLIEPQILIETDGKGRSNLDFTPMGRSAAAPASAEKVARTNAASSERFAGFTLGALKIRGGRIEFQNGTGGKLHRVALHEAAASFEDPQQPMAIFLSGAWEGEDFTLDGRLGPPAAALDPAVPWPVKLEAKALDFDLVLDGTIANPQQARGIDLNFSINADGLARVEAVTGRHLPLVGPLHAAGRLRDTGPGAYLLQPFELSAAPGDVKGRLALDLSSSRPRLTADLTSRHLDLGALAPAAGLGPGPGKRAGKKKAGRVFSDTPLPFKVPDAVEAEVSLRVEELVFAKILAEQVHAAANLKSGRLTLDPIEALVSGGTLKGRLALSAKGGGSTGLEARVRIDALDLGRTLQQLQLTDMVEGEADLWAELEASGASVADLMAGLNGNAGGVAKGGRLHKTFFDPVGGDLASGLLRILDPAAGDSDYTAVNCAVARLDATGGIADVTVLMLDTPRMTLTGQGRVDLGSERLDLTFKPTPKQGLTAGRFGTLSMSLGELTRTVKLGGTLAKPALAVDTSQAALALGKALGGAALLGPAGAGAALAGRASPDQAPCAAAIEAARSGRKPISGQSAKAPPSAAAGNDPVRQLENIVKGLLGR